MKNNSPEEATTTEAAVSTSLALNQEETADEVKVFRSNGHDDDPNELASSSADLKADRQELALEADIESQAEFSQRVNPIVDLFAPLQYPQGNNWMLQQMLALASPATYAAVAQQRLAAAAAVAYTAATAAFMARNSPNYLNLSGGGPFGGAAAFERPPVFSMGGQPCTPSSANQNGHSHQQQRQQQQITESSPMNSLGGALGGISLSASKNNNNPTSKNGNSSSARRLSHKHLQEKAANGENALLNGQIRTPKRVKPEHRSRASENSSDNKREHVKKPMNAFMLFMKMNRQKYMDECGDKKKQSAELNKELGQIWQAMSREEQQPYYDIAKQKRLEHQQLYPNWTARENYAIHKKAKKRRTRERSFENSEQKKCRARFGVDNQQNWCKHCRRKKRCLNVLRDSDSPAQVSSTTNPMTPLSLGLTAHPPLPSSAASNGQQQHHGQPQNLYQFGGLGGLFALDHHQHQQQQQLDSPCSSRKGGFEGRGGGGAERARGEGQSTNSELTRSRCSSAMTTSSGGGDDGGDGGTSDSEMSGDEQDNNRNNNDDEAGGSGAKSSASGGGSAIVEKQKFKEEKMETSSTPPPSRPPLPPKPKHHKRQHLAQATTATAQTPLIDGPKPFAGINNGNNNTQHQSQFAHQNLTADGGRSLLVSAAAAAAAASSLLPQQQHLAFAAGAATQQNHSAAAAASSAAASYQMPNAAAGFPFQANPFLPFNMNFMQQFMK